MATSDLLLAGPTTNVITLGDNQYDIGALAAYQSSYQPSWGRLRDMTRPAPGNHEYGTTNAAGYYSYFGAAAGDPSKGWYSYEIGAWHLIALNSNCGEVGGCGAGSPEETWLRQDLASHANQCTLAYWHHPRFSSGSHGNDTEFDAFWRALYDYNADVVMNGHDHDYERFAPQRPDASPDGARGIREFVIGTGGRSHYGFSAPVANSEVREANTFGIVELTLHSNSYDWRFRPVAGSTFTDSGSSTCH